MIVDFAISEQREEAIDFLVADRAAEADAVDVIDRNEHGRFVRDHSEMIKTARCAENCFRLDALNDAKPMIWVNDLVTNLECHASPTTEGECR